MKATLIGGVGRVGASMAFALQMGGVVCDMVLVGAPKDQARSEAE